MIVSETTKISEIIKENEGAIEAIASINPHFRKLKNPILRKLLATRVSVQQAAKIGNTDTKTFLEKLQSFGMKVSFNESNNTITKTDTIQNNQQTGGVYDEILDVRPILNEGKDPLKEILQTVKKIGQEKTLLLINSFEPIPLIDLLNKKGYRCKVVNKDNSLVHVYISKGNATNTEESSEEFINDEAFEKLINLFGSKINHADVRALEMPGPMVEILKQLNDLEEGYCLLVEHKRIPCFLIPKLQDSGHQYFMRKIAEDHIQIIIYK